MPKKSNEILFLNLYAFSLTGGVEKVSKNFVYTLYCLFGNEGWKSYSMYDNEKDIDVKYTPVERYHAFKNKKTLFVIKSIFTGLKKRTIILSHINLLLIARLVTFFSPKHHFILFAHGIEVWGPLPRWKINFIKKHVEVWAVSNYTKQQLINTHRLLPDKVKVLNNSTSPFLELPNKFTKPEFLIKRYNIDIKKPVLYTLTRLSAFEKYKGYDQVINALSELKAKNITCTYILAGKADSSEKLRIEQLINKNDLQESVKLVGFIPDEELSDHFLLADIFIMPSKKEGFGIVFIEAAAHGCQVIGGNIDGSTDALLNGQLGQLVNPNNEAEIVKAVQIATANEAHQRKTQQDLALAHFSFEQYVQNVAQLLA